MNVSDVTEDRSMKSSGVQMKLHEFLTSVWHMNCELHVPANLSP